MHPFVVNAAAAFSLFAIPVAGYAQAAEMSQVGTLFPPVIHKTFRIEMFRRGLQDLGYVEGKNYVLESRLTGKQDFYRPDLAKELVSLGVDVIVTSEVAGGRAARKATETIPIVVLNCDPYHLLVETLARPGGNVTGQTCMTAETTPKKLELFKMAIPHMSRVAYLYNPKQPGPTLGLKLAREAARSLRITVHPFEVSDAGDFEQAFKKISGQKFDGLFVHHDFITASQRPRILEFAARKKLPAMYGFGSWVRAGGLMSYGTNLAAMYRRAGRQVAKILGGEKPADLPIEQPTTFELFVNPKTAKALGITFSKSILLRVDKVIE
jgi:putative ABC transport system substrate-binding protein